MTESADEKLRRLQALTRFLDEAFVIPGTNMRFGADGLIGLIPGAGDLVTTALSAYIVHQAVQMGVPRHVVARMLANIGIDLLVGAVPLLGDVFDFAWKANRKNLRLLTRHVPQQIPPAV